MKTWWKRVDAQFIATAILIGIGLWFLRDAPDWLTGLVFVAWGYIVYLEGTWYDLRRAVENRNELDKDLTPEQRRRRDLGY